MVMIEQQHNNQEEQEERKLQREQALEQIETVRNMLSRRLKDDEKFLKWLQKIDKDDNKR